MTSCMLGYVVLPQSPQGPLLMERREALDSQVVVPYPALSIEDPSPLQALVAPHPYPVQPLSIRPNLGLC